MAMQVRSAILSDLYNSMFQQGCAARCIAPPFTSSELTLMQAPCLSSALAH